MKIKMWTVSSREALEDYIKRYKSTIPIYSDRSACNDGLWEFWIEGVEVDV